MGRPKIKISVLTSSRADYGIYLPLLMELEKDTDIELSIIAFGTHLKKEFGSTVQQIEEDGFTIDEKIDNLIHGDSAKDVALNYAHTATLFSEIWAHSNYDCVLCLGDRFEMAAAVNAGIPFGVYFAHIHAGETSLGAIDNVYRDQISLAAKLHFVSIKDFKKRIEHIIGYPDTAFYSGAMALENLKSIQILSVKEFRNKWGVDLSKPTILVTVHPETIQPERNQNHIKELEKALRELLEDTQVLATMPNADTLGLTYRKMFERMNDVDNLKIVENLGTQSYFSAMKMSRLLLGNTSSGIIEAASFGKYVINLGERQKGRVHGENVIHVPFNSTYICSAVNKYLNSTYSGRNIYESPLGIKYVIKTLKEKIYVA